MRRGGCRLGFPALQGSPSEHLTPLGALRAGRPPIKGRRRAGTLLLAAGLVTASCSGSTPSGPTETVAAPTPEISIPAGELPPDIQCYIDHGFTLLKITDPIIEGERPGYQLKADLPGDQVAAIRDECEKLAPPNVPKTDAELRVVYDKWVDERDCLIELGYRPAPPPSFEKFAADFRSTGPWMPSDGIDVSAWSDAQYREAKDRCKLEFFTRD